MMLPEAYVKSMETPKVDVTLLEVSGDGSFSYETVYEGQTAVWYVYQEDGEWCETLQGDTDVLARAPSLEELSRSILEVGE